MFMTDPNTETHGSTECACHGGLSDPLSEGWGLILAPLRFACHGGGGTGPAPVVACRARRGWHAAAGPYARPRSVSLSAGIAGHTAVCLGRVVREAGAGRRLLRVQGHVLRAAGLKG